ncbi:MAG: MBOAT family O-acyltransferase [Ferruginibacter sp.]
MLFNSFEFLVFFCIVTGLFFLLPHKFRYLLLLAASCYFYMFFKPVYILILAFTIVVDYFAGLLIAKTTDKRKRKLYLLLSIIANVGILAVFKYFNFIAGNINAVLAAVNAGSHLPLLEILLPIGLSFHTFQAMSYTIEVYRGNQAPEKHFGIYALYVMFYPQLVAGPIERPQNILHQFHEKKYFDPERLQSGLRLILLGLFKKCVIADRLSIAVDAVYADPHGYSGFSILISTVFFAIQIYCDFSGYSDIALGTARCMGFTLMQNFKQPYLSKSISEFWTRWHISLSSWFKDYLYIPLGGNRVAVKRVYFNLLFVFIVSGLWHGANWTFIAWGTLHGLFLIISLILKKTFPKIKLPGFILVALTFTLVCITWIFFRAADIKEALHMVAAIFTYNTGYFTLNQSDLHGLADTYLGLPLWQFCLTSLLVPLMLFIDYMFASGKYQKIYNWPAFARWSLYYLVILLILVAGVFNTNQFIYFQF